MKFLFALQCGNAGGTERVALGHMQRLLALGHECRVVSLEPIAGLGPFLDESGIPALDLDFRRKLGGPAYLALRRVFAQYRPDALIQVGHRLVTQLAALGARIPSKVYYIQHHHLGQKRELSWRLNYAVAAFAYPRLLFVSEYVRHEALQLMPTMRDRCDVLHAPIELRALTTPTMRREARCRLGLPADAWLMGNAGRQVPVKRFDVFLHTAAEVARTRPDARFVIGGAGPENARLRALAAQVGVADRVVWLEWMADMEDFYRSLDLHCFSTDIDALGMVPLEALACGIPVVCSVGEGGLGEILPWHGRYLFDRHDPQQLAAAVLRLVGDEAEAQVAAGRRLIAERCDPHRLTAQLLDAVGAAAVPAAS